MNPYISYLEDLMNPYISYQVPLLVTLLLPLCYQE